MCSLSKFKLNNDKQDKLTNPLTKSDVVNNLTTTTTNVPLSAAQGKVLNDYIVRNKFGSGVTISGYGSTNLYTTPSDGYAYLRGANFNDVVALYIRPSDGNANKQIILQTTGQANGAAHLTTFVKKGMKIYAASSAGFTTCVFYPLE